MNSVAVNLGLVAFSVALLLGVMAAVKLAARRLALGPELQRKIVHVATGLYALTLPVIFADRWPVMVLIAVSVCVMLILRLPAFAVSGVGSALHSVSRGSYGEIYLALAVGFLFFFSQGNPVLYVLPILIVTVSDAAAALIGTNYGRRTFAVEAGTKSIEGVAVFFLITWLIAMIVLLLGTDAPRLNVVLVSFLVAAFGALVEADSWRGLDNLFVPIGAHLFLASHIDTPPAALIVLAIGFVATVTVVLTFAPLLKLDHHAARAYTVLIFLVCSVTAPHNAILPVAAILAHIPARVMRPSRSPYPDLDLLAVATGVALIWLFAGEYFDHSAINMFNLTFAAAAVAFVALACSGWQRWLCVPLSFVAGAAVITIAGQNPVETHWHGLMWPWVVAGLGITLSAALMRPEFFDRFRSIRVFASALIVPAAVFITQGIMA